MEGLHKKGPEVKTRKRVNTSVSRLAFFRCKMVFISASLYCKQKWANKHNGYSFH